MQFASPPRREVLLDATIEYMLKRGVADLSLRPLAAKVGSKERLAHLSLRFKRFPGQRSHDCGARPRAEGLRADGRKWTGLCRVGDNSGVLALGHHEGGTSATCDCFFDVHGMALQKPARYGRYLRAR